MSIVFARCPETFKDNFLFRGRSGCRSERPWEKEEEEEEDSSQKVRRVRRGDVIAIFAGASHYGIMMGTSLSKSYPLPTPS